MLESSPSASSCVIVSGCLSALGLVVVDVNVGNVVVGVDVGNVAGIDVGNVVVGVDVGNVVAVSCSAVDPPVTFTVVRYPLVQLSQFFCISIICKLSPLVVAEVSFIEFLVVKITGIKMTATRRQTVTTEATTYLMHFRLFRPELFFSKIINVGVMSLSSEKLLFNIFGF